MGLVGAAEKSYAYDAFGRRIDWPALFPEGDDANPFRYCGEYWGGELGCVYLRARYYEPDTGRFLSEDPIRDGCNWYVYCSGNPVLRVDPSGKKDYIYTSQSDYYVENDWGVWEFLNSDRYYAEINGKRYLANSKETVTLYDWNKIDIDFLNKTLDELIAKANEKPTDVWRILNESVGGDLDFKLQLDEQTVFLANGLLYNRNEAGNFVWAYFLESHSVSAYLSGMLAQGGSVLSPISGMNGMPRLDEAWDRKARWAGVEYFYSRNNMWWLYFILYWGKPHP